MTTTNDPEVAAAVLQDRVRFIADEMNVPAELRPVFGRVDNARYWLSVDFHEQDDGDDVSEYRYFCFTREHEQDWVIAEAGLSHLDEFLFKVFRTIAHQMAWGQLGRPMVGTFDSRQLAEIQIDLLGKVRPYWATKLIREFRMNGILQ